MKHGKSIMTQYQQKTFQRIFNFSTEHQIVTTKQMNIRLAYIYRTQPIFSSLHVLGMRTSTRVSFRSWTNMFQSSTQLSPLSHPSIAPVSFVSCLLPATKLQKGRNPTAMFKPFFLSYNRKRSIMPRIKTISSLTIQSRLSIQHNDLPASDGA